ATSGKKLDELPSGSVIGTSSLRRRAQLLVLRPDIKVVDLRGNLETRVRKMKELNLDGIVLAWAGLARMDMTHLITEIFAPESMLSAAGQGALAIEIREDDDKIRQLVAKLESPTARIEIAAERAFLAGLGGGCQVPIGARAQVRDGQVHLMGMVASLDGSEMIKVSGVMPINEAEDLGRDLAQQAIARGGQQILAAIPRD
ncbi:MAG: hydroxymethylbilane synthase, partial [Methylocystaceae bacterium]